MNETKVVHEDPASGKSHRSAAKLHLSSVLSLFKNFLCVQQHPDIYPYHTMKSDAARMNVVAKVNSATDVVSYETASSSSPLYSMKNRPEQFLGRR